MKFDTQDLKWRRWVGLIGIWLLVPGGTLIVLAWLFVKAVQLDKNLSAYYNASFGQFMDHKRQEKEAQHDIHSVSNK